MTTLTDLSTLGPTYQAATGSQNTADTTRIDEIAREFEALVLAQLLAPVFTSVEKSSLTRAGPGEDAFETMLQEQYAKSIAERGGIGIADQVRASLIALQAGSSANISPVPGTHPGISQ